MREAAGDRGWSALHTGFLCGVGAYGFWGLAPIYFKAIAHVHPLEVLAHRVFWAAPLLAALLWLGAGWRTGFAALARRRVQLTLVASALLVATNWFTFIWAVTNAAMLEGSLGYYINPIFSVLLGCVFLGERLRLHQWVSVALAACGVAVMAVDVGGMPWVAVTLAVTFGLYGLLRKVAPVGALVGLFFETVVLFPAALATLAWLGSSEQLRFAHDAPATDLLLALAGAVTALPLLMFATAARRLPLSTVGFLQYIAPTGQFLLAVFAYGERFTSVHGWTFALVWGGVALYLVPVPRSAD